MKGKKFRGERKRETERNGYFAKSEREREIEKREKKEYNIRKDGERRIFGE